MPRMYQVLQTNLPVKVADANIQVNLSSEIQKKDLLEKVHSGLMEYLKKELSNFTIELKIEISDDADKQNIIYTSTDKFKYLSEQNPMLESLKKKFNLDLE